MTELWDREVDDALRAMVADTPAIDATVLEHGRERLVTAVRGKGSPTTVTEERAIHPAPPHGRRTRWLAAAAVAAAITGGGVLAQNLGSDQDPRGRAQSKIETASQVLKRAAAQIDVSADGRVAAGQFRYLRAHQWGATAMGNEENAPGKTFVFMTEVFEKHWIPADETDEWLGETDYTDKRKFLVGSEEEMVEAGMNPGGTFSDGRGKSRCGGEVKPEDGKCAGTWTAPTPSWAAALPHDPRQMLERIRADADDDGDESLDARALETVAQALERGLATAPADVRSALYEAIAMMPDIEITERVANLDGRKGTAMGLPARHERLDIIVDSDTGEYIGSRTVRLDGKHGIKPGTVVGSTAVTTAVVDKMGQHPPK